MHRLLIISFGFKLWAVVEGTQPLECYHCSTVPGHSAYNPYCLTDPARPVGSNVTAGSVRCLGVCSTLIWTVTQEILMQPYAIVVEVARNCSRPAMRGCEYFDNSNFPNNTGMTASRCFCGTDLCNAGKNDNLASTTSQPMHIDPTTPRSWKTSLATQFSATATTANGLGASSKSAAFRIRAGKIAITLGFMLRFLPRMDIT
ncbi:hypothetical protein BV898_02133 [Hypsibius exemplaris]|uniref:Protein quiver n=1 Tax=Hypsibius exemplaris TaxID=2072580 RepID=A0A1W0X9I4_HYPEX|nr:hypothetical protein BV898_02133 [Hypsibius exemplaris]